ncbi:UDP-N-acetylglucosamine 2-epimerase (non-hydrolyzing) [Oceanobacillus sp. MO10714A]|uniref:non-hydrolyzing UDP-N-acetylglucosamine 2-epimerase n=2 Tax=Oceanobacillus TaxID=182709 RepID=UPI00300DD326
MMKALTIVGARPQFIKACMLSKAFKSYPHIKEIIVHTGQHYDYNMSDVFFKQLDIAEADYNLAVGSGTHGEQTANMLLKLEKLMMSVKPDVVIVYGDTNSTVAGSLAAAKLHIPIAHIEAGLRSFNKKMPEEMNRIITDHLSDYLFCPTDYAVENLNKEGIKQGVYRTGDIMYDTITHFKPFATKHSFLLDNLKLKEKDYYLATVHRAENTDDPTRLKAIFRAFQQLDKVVVLPLHPRTKSKIMEYQLDDLVRSPNIKLVDPLDYFGMLALAAKADIILTDSGGLQKEACMLQVPCVTLREETEWLETVESGWNKLAGADSQTIIDTIQNIQRPTANQSLYRTGAAHKIANILLKEF